MVTGDVLSCLYRRPLNHPYFVQSKDTGFVIDVEHGNIKSGASIVLWHKKAAAEAANQRWVIENDGFIHLEHFPNLVLDIEGAGGAGTRVILWDKKTENNANQKWTTDHDGFIISKANGLVLDVEGGAQTEGVRLIVWQKKPDHNENQKFSFVE